MKDIRIGEYTLNEIIERHRHWLTEDIEGWEYMCADLSGANLNDVNLRGVNLSDVNLRGADLRYANLCGANLRCADLSNVNLMCADLRYANLCGANLYGANLLVVDGNLIEFRKGKILTENIIGYKKCKNGVTVTLEIPRGAIVFSVNGNKCRTNKAKVIDIEGADRAYSTYKYMSYYVGDEITIYNFNCEYNVECAEGIHFYMSREEAENMIA